MNNILINFKQQILVAIFCIFAMLSNQPAVESQSLFQDDFNSFEQGKWALYGTSVSGSVGDEVIKGRTRFNGVPRYFSQDGISFVRIQLDTHDPGSSNLLGTEMFSRVGFGPPGVTLSANDRADTKISSIVPSATGFEFESRIRFTRPISGMVGAFWTYWNHGDRNQRTPGQQYYLDTSPHYRGHEIDFEMLPK